MSAISFKWMRKFLEIIKKKMQSFFFAIEMKNKDV